MIRNVGCQISELLIDTRVMLLYKNPPKSNIPHPKATCPNHSIESGIRSFLIALGFEKKQKDGWRSVLFSINLFGQQNYTGKRVL